MAYAVASSTTLERDVGSSPTLATKLYFNWQIENITYIKLPDSARMAKALSVFHIFELIFNPLS